MKRYPVVLLPSHRSYLDFLLVTYFLYEFNMQLPVIAAAQGVNVCVYHDLVFIISFVPCRFLTDGRGWSSVEAKWSILYETHVRTGPTLLGSVF